MCPVSLTVWFLCKSCKLNFAKVDDFIEHKKQNHFTEFQCQNTSCIVFEERIESGCDNDSGVMEATAIFLKEEFELANESQMETNSDPNIVSCFDNGMLTWQIAELTAQTSDYGCEDSEPITDILMPNTEYQSQEENTTEISSFPPKHNPYVLVKRLTSKEIQDASPAVNPELNLKAHRKTPYIPKPFKCNQLNCGKAFKYKHQLVAHMKCHSDLRPFGCPHCDKTFKFNYRLGEHLRSHTGERPFKCPVENCGKSYTQSRTLWRHKRMVHCNASNVRYKRRTSKKIQRASSAAQPELTLSKHVTTHSIPRPFKCLLTSCGKEYTTKAALIIHNRNSHSNARPFGCHQCDKAFKFHYQLDDHVRMHTREQTYKCPFENCGKSFATANSFYSHKRGVHRIK